MKAIIRKKLEQAKNGVVYNVEPHISFIAEEADLDRRIAAIMSRLPDKPWLTPKQIGDVIGRSNSWVRERFRAVPGCFNNGNSSKVYLAVPRDVVEKELRSMYRSRIRVGIVE